VMISVSLKSKLNVSSWQSGYAIKSQNVVGTSSQIVSCLSIPTNLINTFLKFHFICELIFYLIKIGDTFLTFCVLMLNRGVN
jgi:hypothetical protein